MPDLVVNAIERLVEALEERGLQATGTAYPSIGTVQLTIVRGDPDLVDLALGDMTDGLLAADQINEEEG